jgi:hypothetical protein
LKVRKRKGRGRGRGRDEGAEEINGRKDANPIISSLINSRSSNPDY